MNPASLAMANGWLLVRLHQKAKKVGEIELAKASLTVPLDVGTVVAAPNDCDFPVGTVVYCPSHLQQLSVPSEFLKQNAPHLPEMPEGFYVLVKPSTIQITLPLHEGDVNG